MGHVEFDINDNNNIAVMRLLLVYNNIGIKCRYVQNFTGIQLRPSVQILLQSESDIIQHFINNHVSLQAFNWRTTGKKRVRHITTFQDSSLLVGVHTTRRYRRSIERVYPVHSNTYYCYTSHRVRPDTNSPRHVSNHVVSARERRRPNTQNIPRVALENVPDTHTRSAYAGSDSPWRYHDNGLTFF